MTPTWKIKRELERLKVQASAIPLAIYEPFLQRRYDPKRPELIKYIDGAVPAKDNLVIFLIYQPKTIAIASKIVSKIRSLCNNVSRSCQSYSVWIRKRHIANYYRGESGGY